MKIPCSHFCKCLAAFLFFIHFEVNAQNNTIQLIAHRGGVVDSTYTENGLPALKKAQEK